MPNFLRRFVTRYFDYSTRHHLKARLRNFDYKFGGAVVALAVVLVLVLKLY
jgi:hypothetical protein